MERLVESKGINCKQITTPNGSKRTRRRNLSIYEHYTVTSDNGGVMRETQKSVDESSKNQEHPRHNINIIDTRCTDSKIFGGITCVFINDTYESGRPNRQRAALTTQRLGTSRDDRRHLR